MIWREKEASPPTLQGRLPRRLVPATSRDLSLPIHGTLVCVVTHTHRSSFLPLHLVGLLGDRHMMSQSSRLPICQPIWIRIGTVPMVVYKYLNWPGTPLGYRVFGGVSIQEFTWKAS
jgi:hypothetical protein